METTKQKPKGVVQYNNHFNLYKYRKIKEFAERPSNSKWNDLIEFKNKLELFYDDTIEIKPKTKTR